MSRIKAQIEHEAEKLGMEFTEYLDMVWEQQHQEKNNYYYEYEPDEVQEYND